MSSQSTSVLTEFSGRSGRILERLNQLHPALIDLSLDRLKRLLKELGNPELQIPPTIHVAGTNGKGSVCAFLRAIGEAAGWRVHVSTSPHLLGVTERFRIAGKLVDESELSEVLETIEKINAEKPITVFEVLTAASFVLFARHPAELSIVEVGLGGRFDATNVVSPTACVITPISMDHEAFLGNTLALIAKEKAGIIKNKVPVITDYQSPEVIEVLQNEAKQHNAPLFIRNNEWSIEQCSNHLTFKDQKGLLSLPIPALQGAHQFGNAGLAVATLRASGLKIPETAWSGITNAQWPARLQRLTGHLTKTLPPEWEIWLDGGHNPGAGIVLADMIKMRWQDRPLHIIVGMKQSKNAHDFLTPLLPLATSIQAVVEPDQHLAMPIKAIIEASQNHATAGPTVQNALRHIIDSSTETGRILICGSLYLAGSVLRQDGWRMS